MKEADEKRKREEELQAIALKQEQERKAKADLQARIQARKKPQSEKICVIRERLNAVPDKYKALKEKPRVQSPSKYRQIVFRKGPFRSKAHTFANNIIRDSQRSSRTSTEQQSEQNLTICDEMNVYTSSN